MPSLRSTRSSDSSRSNHKLEEVGDGEEEFEQADEPQEEEEYDEEEEAETRCICGELDPPDADGLYIQCEKCSVWQHGYCVSISDTVPEKYWCEQCKPELHLIVVTPQGKISKYLPVQPKDSKESAGSRRKSRRAQDDEKDELQQKKKRERGGLSREDARYEAMIQRALEESKKDAQPDTKSEDERGSRRSSRRKRSSEDVDGDEGELSKQSDVEHSDAGKGNGNGQGAEAESKPTTGESRVSRLKRESAENSESNDSTASSSTQKKKAKRTKRSTPSSAGSSKSSSTIDFNKPTRPRIPQQRATLNEMRKRVAAILEFIGRTQVDIATEQKDQNELTKFVEDEKMKLTVDQMFENYNGSLELMDSLTRKLLLWEQTFGKFGDQ
ncbi:unnamed protein product [Cyberlindnera jadinii]|uniref:PHD-type domain-containing protein n=1 Tax=Cyberlindnera jadinii (strain ATCC 18201 / CBS 1600 / BCRC 20928 / JCM 3617 / NBRC 0987 / NRRL Y-1542) TaxID=983966 RepID=A0A0H5C7M8_CYBJN|nr:unnamed protein product [Cyberlindnera jadinii]